MPNCILRNLFEKLFDTDQLEAVFALVFEYVGEQGHLEKKFFF